MMIDAHSLSRKRVFVSYASMFSLGVGLIVAAIGIAHALNLFYPVSLICVRICEYVGYIGWGSSLGMLGWEIQTWDGNSPAERLNQTLAKVFSFLGIFAFVLARELVPAMN